MSKRSTAAQQRERAAQQRRIGVTSAFSVSAGSLVPAIAQSGQADGGSVRTQPVLAPVEIETGVVHVHGLGVDPGDGVTPPLLGLIESDDRGDWDRGATLPIADFAVAATGRGIVASADQDRSFTTRYSQ